MVSVLVGVAVAAGGHLLWLNTPGRGTAVALPGSETSSPFNSEIRRGQPGSSSSPAGTTSEDAPASPAESSTTSRRAASSTTTEPSRTTTTTTSTTSKPPAKQATPPRSSTASAEGGGGPLNTQVVNLVNDERADAGCDPVTVDSRLTVAAQSHSDDMAERGYLDHTTPDGVPFDRRIRQAGYPRPAAENIAMGLSSAQAVMDAWMSSDGHRRNILNCDITTIGVGVNTDGWYWTQNFGY